jgi:hypothetical protein
VVSVFVVVVLLEPEVPDEPPSTTTGGEAGTSTLTLGAGDEPSTIVVLDEGPGTPTTSVVRLLLKKAKAPIATRIRATKAITIAELPLERASESTAMIFSPP